MLNDNFRNENSIYKFKNFLTNLIKVKENPTFAISDPLGLKFLKFPWLNFSYLNEHKFRNNFRDTANLQCYYLLRYQSVALVQSSFIIKIFEINTEFRNIMI